MHRLYDSVNSPSSWQIAKAKVNIERLEHQLLSPWIPPLYLCVPKFSSKINTPACSDLLLLLLLIKILLLLLLFDDNKNIIAVSEF